MPIKPIISPPDVRHLKSRYVVVRHLGDGGFADVWLATDTWLRRSVALKLPKSPTREEADAMVQEAISAARLFPHPHILAVLDVLNCKLDGHDVPALVTEYVDGCDARTFAATRLARRKDALTRTALGLHVVLAAARGLQFAHNADVIHRDVKPGNILIAKWGGVKLGDFGLAKVVTDATRRITRKDARTPLYAAPEQLLGEPASPASDAYALGCTLYEMLEGTAPHDGAANDLALILKKLVDAPDPSKLGGLDFDERLALLELYRGLLSQDPEERPPPQDCVELLADILQRRAWLLHFQPRVIPAAIRRALHLLTGHVDFDGKGDIHGDDVDPIRYADAAEALEVATATIMVGLSRFIFLNRIAWIAIHRD